MLPKVIVHNSTSLDGSLTGFEPDMGLHYGIAAAYRPQAHLVGSNTIKVGIDSYMKEVQDERPEDFEKPTKDASLPYWVIPDTRAQLMGSLHALRRFEFCKDVIVLVSGITPDEYLRYLNERAYDYHVVGREHVDLKDALMLLAGKYKITKILADTGKILGNLLLNQRLVSEVSLLVHPVIVGRRSNNMFSEVSGNSDYRLAKCEKIGRDHVWLVYEAKK